MGAPEAVEHRCLDEKLLAFAFCGLAGGRTTVALTLGGLALFAILLVWQMPHFIAISIVRKRDYEAAGIRTVPGLRGLFWSKVQATVWALAILPVSLALPFTEVAGWPYAIAAALAANPPSGPKRIRSLSPISVPPSTTIGTGLRRILSPGSRTIWSRDACPSTNPRKRPTSRASSRR